MAAQTADLDEDWFIGKPVLRVWELDENSTRYDVITAGPSDEALKKYWWAWAVVALLVGMASLIVFLGIATNKKARQNPFNVYLLYLAVPDFVFSLCCGITCLLNAINGEYWAAWMCAFQQWYCVFGIGANAWLNACITWELYTMLKLGDRRRRYKSPTRLFVTQQALVVFMYTGFLGVLATIDAPNWPFHYGTTSGLACLPIEVDSQSSIFFWLFFFPLFAGIPSVYIMYVTYMVLSRKLLPPTGKRRLLTVYFGRLVVVFYVMWIPTLLILFAFSSFVPPWVHFVGGLWSHLQGAVSAAICLMKPDVGRAVHRFVTCYNCRPSTRQRRRKQREQAASRRQSTASRRASASARRPSSRHVSSSRRTSSSARRTSSSAPRRRSSLSDWLFLRGSGGGGGGILSAVSSGGALEHGSDPTIAHPDCGADHMQEESAAQMAVGDELRVEAGGNWSSFHSTELWPSLSGATNSAYLVSMASSQGLAVIESSSASQHMALEMIDDDHEDDGDDCENGNPTKSNNYSTTAALGSTLDPAFMKVLEDSVEADDMEANGDEEEEVVFEENEVEDDESDSDDESDQHQDNMSSVELQQDDNSLPD